MKSTSTVIAVFSSIFGDCQAKQLISCDLPGPVGCPKHVWNNRVCVPYSNKLARLHSDKETGYTSRRSMAQFLLALEPELCELSDNMALMISHVDGPCVALSGYLNTLNVLDRRIVDISCLIMLLKILMVRMAFDSLILPDELISRHRPELKYLTFF